MRVAYQIAFMKTLTRSNSENIKVQRTGSLPAVLFGCEIFLLVYRNVPETMAVNSGTYKRCASFNCNQVSNYNHTQHITKYYFTFSLPWHCPFTLP